MQTLLITYLYLKTLILFLPTIDLRSSRSPALIDDSSDDDYEEKAYILCQEIESIAHRRKVIKVEKNKRVPITLSLLGCGQEFYLGMKVGIFDPVTEFENGFFLTIN